MTLKIRRSDKFIKNLKRLLRDKTIEITQVEKFLRLLVENPGHPSLRTKKIQGIQGVFEASLNMDIRVTFNYIKPDTIYLRNIGLHDIVLKEY
jgi:mRNA-degrading endonuclease YafQ of YafQ-DinJ toxin-antitoxin module